MLYLIQAHVGNPSMKFSCVTELLLRAEVIIPNCAGDTVYTMNFIVIMTYMQCHHIILESTSWLLTDSDNINFSRPSSKLLTVSPSVFLKCSVWNTLRAVLIQMSCSSPHMSYQLSLSNCKINENVPTADIMLLLCVICTACKKWTHSGLSMSVCMIQHGSRRKDFYEI